MKNTNLIIVICIIFFGINAIAQNANNSKKNIPLPAPKNSLADSMRKVGMGQDPAHSNNAQVVDSQNQVHQNDKNGLNSKQKK